MIENRKIFLPPAPPDKNSSPICQWVVFKRIYTGWRIYAIAPLVTEITDIPTIVQYLMDKIKDACTEPVDMGLPPMRDIQHATNLVLGAQLPNPPNIIWTLTSTMNYKDESKN